MAAVFSRIGDALSTNELMDASTHAAQNSEFLNTLLIAFLGFPCCGQIERLVKITFYG